MKLLKGDCLELMKDIPDNSIDLVLTDPPYGTTACKWDSVINFELMWEQLKRITKDKGVICLFGSEPFSSALRMSNIKMFKYDWIWDKVRATGFQIVKHRPMSKTEIISVFKNGVNCNYYPQKVLKEKPRSNGVYGGKNEAMPTTPEYKKGKSMYSFPKNVLVYSNANQRGKLHPTQKPVTLLEYLVKTYTQEGEVVLDFTMGSGSTGVACKNLNRNFIGIEQDDKYFEIAKERIEND